MNKDAREALSALDNVPIESMLESLRYSMAKAQAALDRTAIDTFKEMVNPDNRIRMEGGESYSLLEIGFSPSFYHFTQATIEVRVAFSAMNQPTEVPPE